MTPRAEAIAPFKKAFQKKYVDPSDNEDFKSAFKKASCNTCHVKGEKKDVRNEYGDALAKLIEGDANQRIKDAGKEGGSEGRKKETEKVVKELEKAFEEVAKQKSKSGESFGDMIKSGKLPS
jgi:hypothetical protein